jgi:hypothetical protein
LAEQTSPVAAKILIDGRKMAERDLPMAQTWKQGTKDPPEGNPNLRHRTRLTRSVRTGFQAPKMKSEEKPIMRTGNKEKSQQEAKPGEEKLGDVKLKNRQRLSG